MYNQLTSEQRYEIYLGIKRKWSISRISREIEVSASTVLREIRRNSNTSGEYVWRTAQRKAEARKHGLEGNHRKPAELWWCIEQMIEEDWSPSQIAGVLHKEGILIAIQTIYNHVHADTSGRLAKHMPHELKYTRRVRATRPTPHQGHEHSQSHKHPRPPQGGGRHTLRRLGDGHHRGFLRPRHCHAYGTFNHFILMERLKCGRKAVPTAKVVARLLFPYREFVHTITTDNGCEFAAHLEITRMLSRGGRERGKVYFADSYCSWQKGAIENANKLLIRKYIPKKANFDDFSDSKIMKIQKKINRRPREEINFDSPKDRFFKHFC